MKKYVITENTTHWIFTNEDGATNNIGKGEGVNTKEEAEAIYLYNENPTIEEIYDIITDYK
jgi:hypothetical protein